MLFVPHAEGSCGEEAVGVFAHHDLVEGEASRLGLLSGDEASLASACEDGQLTDLLHLSFADGDAAEAHLLARVLDGAADGVAEAECAEGGHDAVEAVGDGVEAVAPLCGQQAAVGAVADAEVGVEGVLGVARVEEGLDLFVAQVGEAAVALGVEVGVVA